jgi:predicted transposase YbfD/YdcC
VDVAALTIEENSEIKVVQCLMEKLQLQGVILSLDALHTQKTLSMIADRGNDYLVAVERNHGRLYEYLQSTVQ